MHKNDDKYFDLYSKVYELEGLAGVFKDYCIYKSENEKISLNDFSTHMSFFSESLCEKVKQLYKLLESID